MANRYKLIHTGNRGSEINNLTEKTTPVDADMVGLMDSAASNVLKKLSWANIKAVLMSYITPTGTIVDFGGSSAPTGWLICDGSAISRTTYSALFTAISTTYGTGDGSTTFNIPNCKGAVSVGYDPTQTEFNTLGKIGGAKVHTLTSGESGLVAHSHDVYEADGNYILGYLGSTDSSGSRGVNYDTNGRGTTWRAKEISAANAVSAHNNLQPYIVFNKIIKY